MIEHFVINVTSPNIVANANFICCLCAFDRDDMMSEIAFSSVPKDNKQTNKILLRYSRFVLLVSLYGH